MATLTSQLIVRLIDGVTGPAKAAAQSLQALGRAGQKGGGADLTGRLRSSLESTNRKLDEMRGRIAESAAVGYALKQALQAPIEAAAKFETALLDIAQKAELSDAQMAALGKRMRAMGPTVNQSSAQIAKAMDTLLGMGMKAGTAEVILPTLGKTATAYRAEISDLAKTAMAAIDNLKIKAEELPRAMDMIARAGMEGAFELRDMAQYLPAIAAMAEVNGMRGLDAIVELGAALQITRKGAGDSAEAATNLRNVLQKLTSEEVVKKFKKLGDVDLKEQIADMVKTGVSPLEAIIKITRDVIEKSKGKVKLSELFTDMQMQLGMASLVQHYEEFMRIREEMRKNSDGLVDKDFNRRLKTMQSGIDALSNAWDNFKTVSGEALAPSLLPLLKNMTDLATKIAEVSQAYPKLTSAAVTAISILVGGKIAVLAARWAYLVLKSAVVGVALALTMVGTAIRSLAFASLIAMATRLRGALLALFLTTSAGGIGSGLAMLGGMLLRLLNPMRIVTTAAFLLRGALMLTGVGLVIGGIVAAFTFLKNNWDGITQGAKAFGEEFVKSLGPAGPAVEKVFNFVKDLWKKLDELTAAISPEKWKEWGSAAGKAVGDVVAWFVGLPDRIMAAVRSIDLSNIIKWPSLPSWLGGGKVTAPSTPITPAPAQSVPARAAGGPVSAGQSYLVGERGPELITPSRSGYVHPTGSFGIGGQTAGAGGITVSPVFNMTFNGKTDSEDVVEQIRRVLRDEVRETFRGVFSDTSMRFA
jgi:TP901 family phage tail tape measure protein